MSTPPKKRKGSEVRFTAPKSTPGPDVVGKVLDEVWMGPHTDPVWGEYAFFSELIEWRDGSKSVRLSYYYRAPGKSRWIFGVGGRIKTSQ
jgi:hypothetical protein